MVSARPPPCTWGIEPGTADLDEIKRKRREEKEKSEREEEEGELRDKGMKYLLNVIISNHL